MKILIVIFFSYGYLGDVIKLKICGLDDLYVSILRLVNEMIKHVKWEGASRTWANPECGEIWKWMLSLETRNGLVLNKKP